MLRVKTFLDKSLVHGVGLFADQFIEKGTVTWEFDPSFDTAFSQKQIDSFPKIIQEYLYYYCYFDRALEVFVLCSDHLKFINHSGRNPNIISTPQRDLAGTDIHPGQELLCNYNLFDPDYFSRMGLKEGHLVETF